MLISTKGNMTTRNIDGRLLEYDAATNQFFYGVSTLMNSLTCFQPEFAGNILREFGIQEFRIEEFLDSAKGWTLKQAGNNR